MHKQFDLPLCYEISCLTIMLDYITKGAIYNYNKTYSMLILVNMIFLTQACIEKY